MKQVYIILLCSCVSLVAFADLPAKDDPGLKQHTTSHAQTQGDSKETLNGNCDACDKFMGGPPTPFDMPKMPAPTGQQGTPGNGTVENGTH